MSNEIFMNEKVYRGKIESKIRFYAITIIESILIAILYKFSDEYLKEYSFIGEACLLTFAVLLLGHLYIKKNKYISLYGKLEAYRKAFFRFHVTAMPFIYISALHPIFVNFNGSQVINKYVKIVVSLYFIISALLLHRQSIKVFGVDNLFMYYVYFPEESVKKESLIHSIMRHPIYSAMARMSIGLGILNGTASALMVSVMLPIFQILWLLIFEEKELIQRFGDSYSDYKRDVRAIWVKVKDIRIFWKFILGIN